MGSEVAGGYLDVPYVQPDVGLVEIREQGGAS